MRTGAALSTKQGRFAVWLGLVGVLLLAALSMMVGKYGNGPQPVFDALWQLVTGDGADPVLATVLWNVRLPRVVAAVVVGAALAAAGATYQGLFRNPLVSPDLPGVSVGASLGAVLGTFLSLPVLAIQLIAFAGGLAVVLTVYSVGALVRERDPVLTLVLAGIAIQALIGAGISLIKVLADPYDQLPAITYWLLGSMTAITCFDVLSILPAVLLGLVPLVVLRWRMNVMTLGEEEAQTLGVDTLKTRIAYVPQAQAAPFPFTVRDVVLMGRAAHLSAFAMPGTHDRAIAEAALENLGIAGLAETPCTEISGGERQLALIARALAQQARIIVMDEPTANLDYGNQMRLLAHIRALAGEGLAIVLSTHNPDHTLQVADRVALLKDGSLMALGAPQETLTPDTLKSLYGIDVVVGMVPGSRALVCAPRFGPPPT